MTQFPYGFWIVGSCAGNRLPIDWAAAFTAYASLDERADVNREAYLSAFTFADDFRQYHESTGSTKGFAGASWSPWLWFDIDREDLETARRDTARLALALVERYRLDDDDLLLFHSGSKGFHVGLPTALWGPEPSLTFHRTARRFAEGLAAVAGVIIDTGVYDRVRAFRAPNSRHPKTGRHKRRLSVNEITRLSVPSILDLAAAPAPFDIPAPRHASEQAAADWKAAGEQVTRETETTAERRAANNGRPTLNRMTLEIIRDGTILGTPERVGDRHRLLFSASANLAEFAGYPEALAHELLTESGRDSGLPPAEVYRQIDCGWRSVCSTPAGAASVPPLPTEAAAVPCPKGNTLFPGATGGGYYDAGL